MNITLIKIRKKLFYMKKNNYNIIAFAGRKRSGKTCLCKMLQQEENAVIITIANYLKYLCCELMNMSYEELNEKKDNGYTFNVVPDEKWFNIISKRTNISIEDIKNELQGKHITSIRELLQVIGTDVIRKYNENWHVQKMIEEIESYSEDKLIVIDDVRFQHSDLCHAALCRLYFRRQFLRPAACGIRVIG